MCLCNISHHVGPNVPPCCAGSAFAIDFQQPLALPPLVVEWARVAEDDKTTPDEIIGDLGSASPIAGPADIADAVNPANSDSPASGIANKVIETVQSGPTTSQKALSDALGNPAADVAPKLQDAIEAPAELLKPGRDVSPLPIYISYCAALLTHRLQDVV